MADFPTDQWLAKYETVKHLLKPVSDLNEYFTANEIAGQPVVTFSMGTVNFPTGEIMVRDPLVWITKDEMPYLEKVPAGTYELIACAVVNEDDCARYAAVKVDFTNEPPVNYTEAMIGNENLEGIEEGNYFGFSVDAGLATIIDVKTRDAYLDFEKSWYEEHGKDNNIYDNYFNSLFEESYERYPQYQRKGGDWINWTVPGTELSVPMFQSGFGDGGYPVYFGYDKDGKICRVVIQFIDIELAYQESQDSE